MAYVAYREGMPYKLRKALQHDFTDVEILQDSGTASSQYDAIAQIEFVKYEKPILPASVFGTFETTLTLRLTIIKPANSRVYLFTQKSVLDGKFTVDDAIVIASSIATVAAVNASPVAGAIKTTSPQPFIQGVASAQQELYADIKAYCPEYKGLCRYTYILGATIEKSIHNLASSMSDAIYASISAAQ